MVYFICKIKNQRRNILSFEYYTELLINRQYEADEERVILEQLRDELYEEALNELMYEENQN